jgi:hypothetical protein
MKLRTIKEKSKPEIESKYGFHLMGPGGRVIIRCRRGEMLKVRAGAHNFSHRSGRKFTVRISGKTVHVWRLT